MDPTDPLNERLHAAGDAIAVDDDFAALNVVHDGVARRRKRRRAVTGVGVAALLVAGGVVAVGVVGDGESDSLTIAGVDEPAPSTTVDPSGAVAAAETDAAASDTAPAESIAPPPTTMPPATPSNGGVVVATIDVQATYVPVPADLRDAQLNWIVPWRDGFLASRTLFDPQALPSELPEEIAALFPQEVRDFFDGELPPTINEAIQMLSEAGLLDQVTEVLAEHPEANDYIYSQPTTAPSMSVLYSPDGAEWEPVDFAMPTDSSYLQSVHSTGDRLVAFVQGVDEPVGQPFGYAPTFDLMVTTDLVTWDTLPLPSLEPAAGLPAFARVATYPNTLAVNESGWVASVGRSYDIDVSQLAPLLPADVVEIHESGRGGVDGDFTPDGVMLYVFDDPEVEPPVADEPPAPPEPQMIELTWDELGIDPVLTDPLELGGLALVSGRWSGETAVVDDVNAYQIVGTSDGFYAVTDVVSFSPDGTRWVELTTPAQARFVQTVLSLDRGVVAFGVDDDDDPIAFRVDGTTDVWEAVAVPDVPSNGMGDYYGSDSRLQAMVVNRAGYGFVEEQVVTVEVDGYTVTFASGEFGSGFRLVDADGAVLIDDETSGRGDLPDYVRNDEGGFTFVDLESGDDIVTVTMDQLSAAYAALPPVDYEEPIPDLWVLATLDGERWLFQDLGLDGDDAYLGPTPVAINGTTLVVAAGPDWQVFDLS